MAKTKVSEWSSTPGANTDIDGINLAEGMLPSDVNNAMREMMAQLKDLQSANPTYYTTNSDAIAVGAGGTGAITAADARTNLGLAIGTNVQAYDAQLTDIAGLTPTDNGVIIGNGTNFVLETGTTLRTSLGLAIGADVQAYNANTAFTNATQTFTTPQRGTVTTDNDGSFDQSVTNNFKCTPTATFALTFTNHTAGQSGYVLLVNTGGYAVTAAATTKLSASTLATISTAGTYILAYLDDGTNAYVTASGAMA